MKGAKTVVWNGPMGVFEMKEYARNTGYSSSYGELWAVTIIGGGDSQQLLNNWVLQKNDTYFNRRRSFFRVYGRQGAARNISFK